MVAAIDSPTAPAAVREVAAVGALRWIWIQPYLAAQTPGCAAWRADEQLAPAAVLITSPHDVEARSAKKRATEWRGCQVHLSET